MPPLPGLGPLIAIPVDVVGTLRALPRLFAQIEAISTHTAQVAAATDPLPSVADHTTVLPPMYERMTGTVQPIGRIADRLPGRK